MLQCSPHLSANRRGWCGVDTLQAAEPPYSVSDGPVEINLRPSAANGGLIY